MSAQIIKKNGQPDWAAAQHLAKGEEERLPADMVERLLDESPYRVWREHRGLTLESVATAAGVTRGYVSMIESGKRRPSCDIQAGIARALGVQ